MSLVGGVSCHRLCMVTIAEEGEEEERKEGKGGRRKEGREESELGRLTRRQAGRSVKNWWKARKERGWRREGVLA